MDGVKSLLAILSLQERLRGRKKLHPFVATGDW
jgi:hypothetical protein